MYNFHTTTLPPKGLGTALASTGPLLILGFSMPIASNAQYSNFTFAAMNLT